ncbi:hypothetical protein EX895_006301 [Sporisorium graminicola]|uniref:Uncharacterized protein n=1 Tax=Sporisorium graminicola TaxID=280036 RepID=A0A4U7KLV7_9BASI|nr:hypothetical protein EX895_006301 [Sporisorium graminicola]TKY85221.1 hypothetical protein EX895_006301 [Sporisorium graminicola]
MVAQRTASSSCNTRSRSVRNNLSVAPHGAPGHQIDDCPGCRAEMNDAIQASLRSAQQENEKRHQEQQEQQELQRVYAANVEENDRQRRLAQEEEQLLQQAIEDSRREAEQQAQRSRLNEELLIEESRQYALRQREESAKREAQMLEAAKLASSEQEEKRRRELVAMHDAEKRALQLSLQEQEEEWARRESAERSVLEFLDQRSSKDPSAASSSSSVQPQSSSVEADDLDAEYWRFTGHDEAYQLALQMQQASLSDSHQQKVASTSRTRRPLPRTPEAQAHGDETGDTTFWSASKRDKESASSQPATLYNATQEAPPAYSEATQPGPSNPSNARISAGRPPEKACADRYDAATLANLNRPVLQHQSSSSSSAYSQSQGSDTTQSLRTSFGGVSQQSNTSQPSMSAQESSPAPDPASASPSIPQRGSSHSTPAPKRMSSASSIAPEQRGQRALAGLDFGYCSLPFADKLVRSPLPSSQSASMTDLAFASSASNSTSASTSKALFPSTIELSKVAQDSASGARLSPCSFFVLRAYSWKSLLRAIAWYGNSRVEAAPAEVAAASDRRSRCLLHAEVEFVTPIRVDIGYGVGEYARAAQSTGSMPKNPAPVHVALCLSLLPVSASKSPSAGEASAWLKSDEYQIIKRESRRLDAWYAGKGSTRRLIQLARQPPALPVVMVQIAQLLHASHSFSAACPSSGSTARHSPRDLHHAIERHDEGFVRKQQAMLTAGSALAAQSGAGTPSNPRLSMQSPSRTSISGDRVAGADDDELDDDDDDGDQVDFNDFSLLADGSFDAQDKELMGKRQRLKAKVKRRLAKRNSDGRVVDEDLATWITPFDLSQHG